MHTGRVQGGLISAAEIVDGQEHGGGRGRGGGGCGVVSRTAAAATAAAGAVVVFLHAGGAVQHAAHLTTHINGYAGTRPDDRRGKNAAGEIT